MKDEINKYVAIESPLVKSSEDPDKIDITFENKKIIIAILYRDNYNTIEFNFFKEFSLLSPSLKILDKYSINYSKVPLKIKNIEDFKYIIFRIDNDFYVFTLSYDNDYQITSEDQQKFCFKFSTEQSFNIKINKYEKLADFYIQINKNYNLLPLWLNNPGVMIGFNEFMNEGITFADIKSEIKNNEIYVILKNWIYYSKNFNNKKKFNINNFIQKANFNNIRYILQYNNCISEEKNKDFSIVRMRNGELFLDNNTVLIDYFNKQGEDELYNCYKEIFSLNSSGIYLYPPYFFLSDEGYLDKVVTKGAHEILVYSKNVKKGLVRINNIINKLKNNDSKENSIFITNVLSESLSSGVYLKEIFSSLDVEVVNFEDLYKQGFMNFGLYLKQKDIIFNKKEIIKIFILIFCVPVFIFDLNLIMNLSKNENYKENLLNILKTRFSLNSLFDNVLIDFIKYGIIPIKTVFKINIFKGFLIGRYLYCALLNEGLLNNDLYLPEGKWYSLEDDFIINGGCNFVYKGSKKNYYLLQKENTIVIYNQTSEFNKLLKNKKIKFVVFYKGDFLQDKKVKKKILERILIDNKTIEIYHNFELKKIKNKILIKYISGNKDNLGRDIIFDFVLDQKETDYIFCNNKKIIYNRKKNSVEFNSVNKENKLIFEITFLE